MFNRKARAAQTAQSYSYALKDFMGVDAQDPTLVDSLMKQVMELEVKIRDQQEQIGLLEQDVMTDSLTGLANRRVFEEELVKSLARAKRHKGKSAILYIDIDAFKSINDEFGHLAGDEALIQVSKILKDNIRPTDVVARLGGDEFCIILNEVKSSYDLNSRSENLESIVARTPLIVNGKNIMLTISVGGRVFGTKDTFEEIMADADMLMYSRKADK